VGSGNTRVVNGPVGGLVLDLDYDASSAEANELFNFSVRIGATGDLTLDAFSCQATSCLADITGFPDSFSVSGGDDIQGETGVKDLGLLTISGTFGTVEILDGNYFDPGFGPTFERDIDPFVLAQVVPEPGTLRRVWPCSGGGLPNDAPGIRGRVRTPGPRPEGRD
jgi:hypothetical protein